MFPKAVRLLRRSLLEVFTLLCIYDAAAGSGGLVNPAR